MGNWRILANNDITGYIGPTNFSFKKANMPYVAVKAATVFKKRKKSKQTGPVWQLKMVILSQDPRWVISIARRRKSTNPEDLVTVFKYDGVDVGVMANHEF